MDRTLLSWNVVNWITVLLMVTLGYAIVGALITLVQTRSGGSVPGMPGLRSVFAKMGLNNQTAASVAS